MNIPITGRIAIVDDNIKQVMPLMNILSQRQIAYSYYSGDYSYLPNDDTKNNDIRLLFLDINLIDDAEHPEKELKAKLVPVLKKVISPNNYPYVIIYWSRHEHIKKMIEEDIFVNDIPDRKPISYLSASKSDFVNFDGELTDDFEEKIVDLFSQINGKIETYPSYKYLLKWENKLHVSADDTLKEIFSEFKDSKDWSNYSSYIIEKLAKAQMGKRYLNAEATERLKSSYLAFNSIFVDTLESSIFNDLLENIILNCEESKVDKDKVVKTINTKLLISKANSQSKVNSDQPGAVIHFKRFRNHYDEILNSICPNTKNNEKIKNLIKEGWRKIGVIVTPTCDYVQNKNKFNRLVKGILIDNQYLKHVDKSEAIFVSPVFDFEDKKYNLVLDFRYFTTINSKGLSKITQLFKLRTILISEIQSKLARHISRQGILFID